MQVQEIITINGKQYPHLREATPEEEAELQDGQKENEITALKRQLAETDYKAIKYAEGIYGDAEYAPIKAERQSMRDRINKLEREL